MQGQGGMLGGEGLSPIDLHSFTDIDEQKISKEILAIVEKFADLTYLPNITDSMHLLQKEFEKENITKNNKTIPVAVAVRICEKIVVRTQFYELCESLSANGELDTNTLIIVLVMLSSGELEDKLKVLFSLIAIQPEEVGKTKAKSKKMMVTKEGLVEAGQVALSCLIMLNLSVDPFREREYKLALFDPQIIMLVARSHLDRAISDVCDFHHVPVHLQATKSLIDFNEYVQICLNVFYNLVEASTMKVFETPLRSRNDPVLRRFTDDGLDTTMEERLQRRVSNSEASQVSTPNIGYSSSGIGRDDPLGSVTETPVGASSAEIIHRKSLKDLAEDMADTAADEAREQEGADHAAPPPTLAGLIQDFGLRLFFLSGVRFALALVFLAANGSLIMVLVNRFDYTVEVALGFALVFDLGVALVAFYLASRLKKLESNLAMLEGEGEGDLGDLPEEIDSIVPGLGKMLPSTLSFFTGMGRGGRGAATPKKAGKGQAKVKRDSGQGNSFISTIKGFFGGGKNNPSNGASSSNQHKKNRSRSINAQSFTEMDFTPFKGDMRLQSGRHSRQPSAEIVFGGSSTDRLQV